VQINPKLPHITAKRPALEAAVPILSVADLRAALEYYQRVLGFRIGWRWGEPPSLASVCRDRVELNLSQSSSTAIAVSKVYFQMTGVAAYFNEVVAAGANIAAPLAERQYGMHDFRLVDPSGNELSFGEASGA
jgi:uncharacterized glyoxalase superfamily protein PhnB